MLDCSSKLKIVESSGCLFCVSIESLIGGQAISVEETSSMLNIFINGIEPIT